MKTIKKTIALYYRSAMRYKLWLILHLFLLSIAIILGSIVIPYIMSKGVEKLSGYQNNVNNFWDYFGTIIIAFIVCEVISWIIWRLGGLVVMKLEISTMRDLNQKVFNHLTKMSNRFFNDSFSGSLVAQTNRFVTAFERLYDIISYELLQIVIKMVFSTAILATFAPKIALGLIIWSAIYTLSSIFLSIKKLPLSKKAASNQSKTTGQLADNLTNITNIKYFAQEKYEIKRYKKTLNEAAHSYFWDWGMSEAIYAWQGFLALLFEIIVFWMSLSLVASGQINIGQLVLIQLYYLNIIMSLWSVPRIVRRIEQSFADATEMTEILYTKPEIKDVSKPLECKIRNGLIEFKNVTFDHQDTEENDSLFKNLTFTIKPGERVGLAGPSGGGKTTLTKLILRMTDIDNGVIAIDGQDISKLKQADLRECITYVPQEPILFHRSLLENISYGNPKASFDDCMGSAVQANADEFISKLSDGYDTLVGERGVKLSGGQRQRVAIARAMLKDAPILLLDEATSALDSESESLIQDALWKLMQDRTAIVIAHRLSTIQKLDRIIVLDDGKIVEEGSHKVLLSKKGLYAKLWAHQSGGFIKD